MIQMEKVNSNRKGSIWLNVFRTDDGQILVTVNKSFMNRDCQWSWTPFLNTRRGDLHDLMDLLIEFHESEKSIKVEGGRAPQLPPVMSKKAPLPSQ